MTSISDTEVVNAPGGLVELGFSVAPSSTTVTATSIGSAHQLGSVTFVSDGSPVLVEFSAGVVSPPTANSSLIFIALEVDGSTTNRIYWISIRNSASAGNYLDQSAYAQERLTLSAGVHTIRTLTWASGGTNGVVHSGGNYSPAITRVSKIIQASQLLVTQSNAPIVTSLPAGNLVTGQEVDLYSTSPYAGYQRQKWDGTQWNRMTDSRGFGVWQSFTPTITQNVNVTFTVNYAKYVIFGKTVFVNFNLSITSSGTASNTIFMNFGSGSTALPTALSSSGVHGSFRWFDAGVTNWVGTICGSSATSVFFTNDGNGNNTGFSGTLTNGDVIEGNFMYEAA